MSATADRTTARDPGRMPEAAGSHNCLDLLAEATRTALLVVDMQNDYCNPSPRRAGSPKDVSLIRASLLPQARLIKKAADAGCLVIFVKNTVEAGHVSDSPAYLHQKIRAAGLKSPGGAPGETLDYVMAGSRGAEVIDDLKGLAPGAPTVKKHRASAFVHTNLEVLLRSNRVQTVIVTGCVTEGCVAATVRDALARDYFCVVPRDCVGGYSRERHDAALEVLASLIDVTDSAAVMATWDNAMSTPRRTGHPNPAE